MTVRVCAIQRGEVWTVEIWINGVCYRTSAPSKEVATQLVREATKAFKLDGALE